MRRRALIIGDVGPVDGVFHVGDEAMTERAIAELRSRGWQHITVISANPDDTSRRYSVDSVSTSDVARADEDQSDILSGILADSDLVVVAGGGNLNDFWPGHVDLRLRVCEAASEQLVDIVITGQGLGPFCTERGQERVRRLLDTARLVGVRDPQSHALCVEWGLSADKVFVGVDDAYERLSDFSGVSPGLPDTTPPKYAVASFTQWHGGLSSPEEHLEVCVQLVKELNVVTDLPVLLVPQEGSLSDARVHDVALHDQIEAVLGANIAKSLAISAPTTCRELIRQSQMVLSSRFHPVVFAMAEAVPALGVVVDHYSYAKLGQALSGQGSLAITIPAPLFNAQDAHEAISVVWEARDLIRSTLTDTYSTVREYQTAWWDLVSGTTDPGTLKRVQLASNGRLARQTERFSGVVSVAARLAHESEMMSTMAQRVWKAQSGALEYIASLETHLSAAVESERTAREYAQSLEADRARTTEDLRVAIEYAESLQVHLSLAREQASDAALYAKSLEAEIMKKANSRKPAE